MSRIQQASRGGVTDRRWASVKPNFGLWTSGTKFPTTMPRVIELPSTTCSVPMPCILNPGASLWNNVKSTSAPKHSPMYGVGQMFNE